MRKILIIITTISALIYSCVDHKIDKVVPVKRKVKAEIDLATAYYLFRHDKGGCLGLRSSINLEKFLLGLYRDSVMTALGKPDIISIDKSQYTYYTNGEYCNAGYGRPRKKYNELPYATLILIFDSNRVSNVLHGYGN